MIRNLAREAGEVDAQRRVRVIGPHAPPSPNAPRASSPPASHATIIRDRALALGFDAVGFCRAELGPEARQRLAAFLAAGQHGDMGWLAARADQRSPVSYTHLTLPTKA